MAQSLSERINAALGKSSRLKDVRDTLAAARTALVESQSAHEEAEQKKLDLNASAAEVAQARLESEDRDLEAKRLAIAITRLEARIAEIEADDAYRGQRDRYAEAKAANEELQKVIAERVPVLFAELQAIADRIEDNDALIVGVNQDLPRGAAPLKSAEALARGVPVNFSHDSGPVTRLTKLKLPNFSGSGYMLTREQRLSRERAAARDEVERRRYLAEAEARKPENIAAAQAMNDARYALYYVQQDNYRGSPVFGIQHRGGSVGIYHVDPDYGPGILEMDESQVRAARAEGIRCEPVPATIKRYRVSGSSDFWGSAPTIETVTGRAPIAGRGPVPCIMTEEQAQAARDAGFIVEAVDRETSKAPA